MGQEDLDQGQVVSLQDIRDEQRPSRNGDSPDEHDGQGQQEVGGQFFELGYRT